MHGAFAVEGDHGKRASCRRQNTDRTLPGKNGGHAHRKNEHEQPHDMGCPFLPAAVVKDEITYSRDPVDKRACRRAHHRLLNTAEHIRDQLGDENMLPLFYIIDEKGENTQAQTVYLTGNIQR